MWDKDLGSPCVPLLWAFYSSCLYIFRCCPAKSDFTQKNAFAWVKILCAYVHLPVSHFDTLPRMKYHLLLDSPAHSGNHQVCLQIFCAAGDVYRADPAWPTEGWLTDRPLTSLLDSSIVSWGTYCLFLIKYLLCDRVCHEKADKYVCRRNHFCR